MGVGEGEEGLFCTVFRSFRKFEIVRPVVSQDDRKEGCRAPAGRGALRSQGLTMLVRTQSWPVEMEQGGGRSPCWGGLPAGRAGAGSQVWPLSCPEVDSHLRTFLLSAVESSSESDPSSALLSMIN